VRSLSYTFDSSLQGFTIDTFHDTAVTNLGYELAPDAGYAANPPALSWDMTDGNPVTPTAGCLRLSATFTGYYQYVAVEVSLSPAANLMGKQIVAFVQMASATGGTFPGGAFLEADTTQAYTYGGSTGTAILTAGTWMPLVLDLDTVSTAGYDDTMVVQVGIQFYSGGPPVAGGTTFGPVTTTFLIDTIHTI
jgi:hypothetical protein